MVWTGTEESLLSFFKEINTVHDTIKFDCNYSRNNINFLDATVFKNQRKSLSTKLYTKPADRPGYIHRQSYHPKSQIKNIPYGQALRAKRISTEQKDLEHALDDLKRNFTKRGYDENQVNEQFARVQQINRKDLLQYNDNKDENKLKFMTKYNRNLPEIREIIDKNWSILKANGKQAKVFQDKPIITFKRNKNLKDMLGGAKLMNNRKVVTKQAKKGHCGPCLTQIGNICCKHIISTNTFKNARTGDEFQIKHNVNCKTKKGIYLASCKLCVKHQYVGKFETSWSERLYNHRKDAKKTKSIPFDEHFLKPGHDFTKHARFVIIETLTKRINTETDRKTLEAREDYWVSRLHTHAPDGFNDIWNNTTRKRIQQNCT